MYVNVANCIDNAFIREFPEFTAEGRGGGWSEIFRGTKFLWTADQWWGGTRIFLPVTKENFHHLGGKTVIFFA